MSRPKQGNICRMHGTQHKDPLFKGDYFYVICTKAMKLTFKAVSGPFSKIEQYSISSIDQVLEGDEAMMAYREIMNPKGKE